MKMFGHRAVAVFVITALASTITGCSSGGPVKPISPDETPTTTETPFTTNGDDGQIVVVERGFSMIAKKNDFDRLSFGVVLENTNRAAVAFPAYLIKFLDAKGKQIRGIDEISEWLSPPRVLPGGRYGVGGTIPYVSSQRLADIRVTITETTWIPNNTQGQFSKITAGQVRTERSAGAPTTLTFTIDSAFNKPVPGVDVSVIFRDTAGKIVGGVDHVVSRLSVNATDVPPGRSIHEMELRDGTPAGADDDRTEVYAFPNQLPLP
jgi:hypothetical protein